MFNHYKRFLQRNFCYANYIINKILFIQIPVNLENTIREFEMTGN